jgi:hypothetical protein
MWSLIQSLEAVSEPGRPAAAFTNYVNWRTQCAAVQSAYERWTSGSGDSGLSFALYRAELEFEEHAASVYRASLGVPATPSR